MAKRAQTLSEKIFREQRKYTDSHGGPELRVDTKGQYYCLRCGHFVCNEGSLKSQCPACGMKFDEQKYIVKTPVL